MNEAIRDSITTLTKRLAGLRDVEEIKRAIAAVDACAAFARATLAMRCGARAAVPRWHQFTTLEQQLARVVAVAAGHVDPIESRLVLAGADVPVRGLEDARRALAFHPARDECKLDAGHCYVCAVRDCPSFDPLHYRAAGCPTCRPAS